MPEIVVYAVAGRSSSEKHGLMRDITDAVVKNFGVNSEFVTVQIVECPSDLKSRGGIPYSVRPPQEVLIGEKGRS